MPEPEVLDATPEVPAESPATSGSDGTAAPSAPAEEGKTQPETGEESPERKAKGGVQRRIDELVREKAVLEAKAEYFRDLALGKKPDKPAEEAKPAEAKPRPKPQDFEDTDKYLDARDEWIREDSRRVAREEYEAAKRADAQKSQEQEQAESWGKRKATFSEKHEDYTEVSQSALRAFREFPAADAISDVILSDEQGPAILYHLGQNPEELAAFAKLSPMAAVMRLGAIQARLAGETPAAPPPMTRAPKPPTPIRHSSPVDNGELRDDLPPKEWEKRFLKKMENK